MRELALFAGAGGGILGGQLLGWRTVCAVEINPYCWSVLLARQRDGMLDPFPIWDDVRTFDPTPWKGHVDVISGGFPCQGISSAGKGLGITDERSSLVFEMLWIINAIRPRFIFAENSPLLRTRGLGSILEALDSMGYDARWCVLGARHVGAPHRRNRMWIQAELRNPDGDSKPTLPIDDEMAGLPEYAADTKCMQLRDESGRIGRQDRPNTAEFGDASRWSIEPPVGRVANGVAHQLDESRKDG